VDAPHWTRVAATVPDALAELAADALWRCGTAGVEEQAGPDGHVRLLAGFEVPTAAASAIDALAEVGVTAELTTIDADAAEAALDAWRPHAEVVRAGRWWLVPAWLEVPAAAPPDDVLHLDPGRTFGSGSHPTTRLVLEAVDRLVSPGARVLDVGCGSGVLAIGAARRGAAEVVAIDVDPEAPAATHANAARNGVADRVAASNRPLAEVAEVDAAGAGFDLVLANLLAPIVRSLGPDLVRATAPGGALVVSGLLADRWAEATLALAPLEVAEVHEAEGWVAVVVRHAPSTIADGPR
jgi:ribosomal protein L11 methyltransferase